MAYEATRRVETSARTFAIVERLDRGGSARISTLASDLDMSKGIVHNHVSTLRELGYVTKIGDQYQLSAKLVAIGHRVRTESSLYRAANGILEAYAHRTDRGVLSFQRAGDDAIVVDEHGLSPDFELSVGTVRPCSRTLPGALLGLDAETSDGPDRAGNDDAEYDPTRLRTSLADCGFVVGPLTPNGRTRCAAFPVIDDEGAQHGSVAVTLPGHVGAALPDDVSVTHPDDVDERRRESVESIPRLRSRIEKRLGEDTTGGRSFATEKHTWIDG